MPAVATTPSADGAVRAKLIVAEGLNPVQITQPVVVGKDPYGSDQAVARMMQLANVGNAQAPLITTNEVPAVDPNNSAPPIAPAPVPVPVSPIPSSDVKLDQPEPIKF